jgi:hypothetical protein
MAQADPSVVANLGRRIGQVTIARVMLTVSISKEISPDAKSMLFWQPQWATS